MNIPISIINDGGPLFMIPLVVFILVIAGLLVLSLIKKPSQKLSKLISHISLFALVWGFLGSTLGLIQAFDAIESVGGVSDGRMAGGLKIALLTTLFGLVAFLVGRLALIIITLKGEKEATTKS